MAIAKGLSDFILTGCAIVPVIALAFGHPELALLSHIVLLMSGILFAASEDDAPFKQPHAYTERAREQSADTGTGTRAHAERTPANVLAPLHQRSELRREDLGPAAAERKLD